MLLEPHPFYIAFLGGSRKRLEISSSSSNSMCSLALREQQPLRAAASGGALLVTGLPSSSSCPSLHTEKPGTSCAPRSPFTGQENRNDIRPCFAGCCRINDFTTCKTAQDSLLCLAQSTHLLCSLSVCHCWHSCHGCLSFLHIYLEREKTFQRNI